MLQLQKVSYVVLCLKTEGAESSLALVVLIVQGRFVPKLLENVVDSLVILHVHIVDHNAGHLLLLGNLSAYSSAIVAALSKQSCVFDQLALVAKPMTHALLFNW